MVAVRGSVKFTQEILSKRLLAVSQKLAIVSRQAAGATAEAAAAEKKLEAVNQKLAAVSRQAAEATAEAAQFPAFLIQRASNFIEHSDPRPHLPEESSMEVGLVAAATGARGKNRCHWP